MSGDVRILGLLALGLATFGAAPILVRLAGADADPIAITTVRTVVAALVLLPLWWWHPLGRASTPRDAGGSWRWSILSGLFLALHFTLWIASLGYTSVASASVLVTCHPVLLIVIESVLFRVAFRPLTWLGVLVAFGGTVMLALSDRTPATTYTDPLLGNLLAFVAALLFVGYILISQRIRRLHSWLDYVARVYLATAMFTVVIFVLTDRSLEMLTPAALTSGILLALGAQLVGHGALNYAVKFVAPTLLSTLVLAEPLFATLLAVALLGEIPAPLAAVAMVLTLGGILLSWWGRRAPLV